MDLKLLGETIVEALNEDGSDDAINALCEDSQNLEVRSDLSSRSKFAGIPAFAGIYP